MKTKYTIGLLLLLITTALIAQNKKAATYQINADVSYDDSNEKIQQASITIFGNNKLYQTITDSNGQFFLDALENGLYYVVINVQGINKEYFDFFINDNNTEADFKIIKNYTLTFSCPAIRIKDIDVFHSVRAPNQQIDALAAYIGRGVDYRHSNTINFGNSNEIIIGKH